MSIGTYVVNNTQQVSPTCKAILGFRSVLNAVDAIQTEDPDYPLSNALDYKYNTEYSPSHATTSVIEFVLPALQSINYFMIISKNAEQSELSVVVDVFRASTGAYEQVAGFGSMTNAVPVMVYFGDEFETGFADAVRIKITLTYTSKPYIMSMMCGNAIVFPRTFSLGFQPASLNSMDEVRQFQTEEGLNVVSGRRLARGRKSRGTINYVRMSTVKTFWREYENHVLDSKPVCLMWNNTDPSDTVYGLQNPGNLPEIGYKTSLFTSLEFDIRGWA